MCGIAGTYGFGGPGILQTMIETLAHRGPDGESFFSDPEGEVWLANRRLAIQDVEEGDQPMTNEDGSIVVVYNGEIYNYPELRRELTGCGHTLRTRCDTELLPHLYEDHGIGFLRRLNGIYAFALWDRRRKTLWLARDPMGVKPLVYARLGGRVAFGSEAKAVLSSGLVHPELDETSLHLSMNVRYIPGNRTLFAGIHRLAPGSAMELGPGKAAHHTVVTIDWTPDHGPSEASWVSGIREKLEGAVRRQLLSDVEVGVSLSGGVDSSSVVALVRRLHRGPLRTFTLGFGEPWDENDDARFVARRFGTDHSEIVLTEPAMKHLEEAIWHTEEPKVNCLQLYLLHRFIGDNVKVVLSGLGGDELFAGYDIYRYLRLLRPVRKTAPGGLLRGIRPALELLARRGSGLERPTMDLWVRGVEWVASFDDPARHYLLLRNAWDFNEVLLRRVYTPAFRERLRFRVRQAYEGYFHDGRALESRVLRAEMGTKLVNDLLHNEDTMSMAHSVESRVPLLDLEFVRYVARIPDELRFGKGLKGLLKEAMKDDLPSETLSKKKWGFTVDPVEQYRKDLRPLAQTWLTEERLREGGIFQPDFVRQIMAAPRRRRLRWHYFMLWQMIGFEMWRDLFLRSSHTTNKATGRAVSRRTS